VLKCIINSAAVLFRCSGGCQEPGSSREVFPCSCVNTFCSALPADLSRIPAYSQVVSADFKVIFSFCNNTHMIQLHVNQVPRKSKIIPEFTDMKYNAVRGEKGALQNA
jgi:hypothetical protein